MQVPSAFSDWTALKAPGETVFSQLKHCPNRDPSIIKTVTLQNDGSWLVRVFGRPLQLASNFPGKLATTIMAFDLLRFVEKLLLCCGNPDPRFIAFAKSQGGAVTTNSTLVDDVVDDPFKEGITHPSTIRHIDCMTVVQNGKQCTTCQTFRTSLRSLVSRFVTRAESTSRTDVESKTPLSYLNKDELLTRAKAMAKSLKSVKDTMARHIKRKLCDAVANDGINVDNDVSTGLQQVMSNATPSIMDSYPEDSFGRLFWEQQHKALQAADPRGRRWHPMMIKWCLNIKLASAKAYGILRDTIKLPNESTLKIHSLDITEKWLQC